MVDGEEFIANGDVQRDVVRADVDVLAVLIHLIVEVKDLENRLLARFAGTARAQRVADQASDKVEGKLVPASRRMKPQR